MNKIMVEESELDILQSHARLGEMSFIRIGAGNNVQEGSAEVSHMVG